MYCVLDFPKYFVLQEGIFSSSPPLYVSFETKALADLLW